jgi:glycerol-3-phosphate O-acyltransferase
VHYFVNEALLSASSLHLASFTEFTVSELREETKFLSRMFKYEFIYRAFESYDSIFKNTFAFFMDEHIFSLGDGERLFLTDGANEVLSFFSGIIFNFIESYWIFARSLISGEKKPQSEKELIRNAQRLGERLYLTGDVLFRESVSSVNFKNCLNFLIDQGLVDLKEGDKTDSFVLNTDTDKGDNYPIKEFFEHLESLHSSLRPRV